MTTTLHIALMASLLVGSTAAAQPLGTPTAPRTRCSTEMPPGVAMPASVESRLGNLTAFDGFQVAASQAATGTKQAPTAP